ncbi:MAG: isoprenylcysteine carboxylmethyltransferase family protein [Planctomycetaceae bacterium]|nr:isoprenylcysteine carboxylmethyltransferase family protein [Planctomycetaceae bacterium]
MELQAANISTRARVTTAFRIQFSVLLLLCGWTLAAFSSPPVSEHNAWATAADALGWTSFACGALFRFWSICHIAGRKSQMVVDYGPYALCRNPLYVGTFLIVASETLFLKSAWFALSLVTLVGFYQLIVVPGEEQRLLSRFGAAFHGYASRVPRWIPRFDPRCLAAVEVRDRAAVLSEIQCLIWWMVVPILGYLTCYARALPWWPHYVPGF